MQAPLRFITCGSVDDGKSTLIGRLLYDSAQVFEDQWQALQASGQPDFAHLVDGLQAEREQGITIDVAYRFFATPRRHFIVADCPGHEQYTRNMATGASTADLAVLLVDARKGLLPQTHRHARIVALMGVKRVVLAINKLDLVGFDEGVYDRIVAAFEAFAEGLGFEGVAAIPVVALAGDNVATCSTRMPWYDGPTLLAHLEEVPVGSRAADAPFRLPVQWVNRPGPDFRGYAGRITAGRVRPGDPVRILPSGATTRVARLVAPDGDLAEARAGDAVTLVLEDERDVSRGDVLAAAAAPCQVADQFEAQLVWLHERPLVPGRTYRARIHTKGAGATITALKWKLDVDTGARLAARTLGLNEIAAVNVAFDQPVAFAPYAACPGLGAFILVDRLTEETVGAGMIGFALRRAGNIHWQPSRVEAAERAAAMGQRPCCVWLTGLSGAGKSTIAGLLEQRVLAAGGHPYVLDGDNLRHGLNKDLGFTAADRVENMRRVAEVARLMVDAGLVVIASLISPFRAERDWARSRFGPGQFLEVLVTAPFEVCAERDPKGLYAKALRGELPNFTGVDSPYEAPVAPELVLDTTALDPEACVDRLMSYMGWA